MTPSHPIVQAVRRHFSPGDRTIVALSGGADSVALTAALVEAGVKVHAVHCNYHLRGSESDRDEAHAREIAARLGVDITVINCNTVAYQQAHPATSIEMACRDMRYTAFREVSGRLNIDTIAVAHHLEDNIETMLLNLFRGSGIKGLCGMSSDRDGIVRPLLHNTRQQIIDYLNIIGVDYVVDSSNLTSVFRRNAIRNIILPAIHDHFPSADAGLQATMSALASQKRLLQSFIKQSIAKYVSPDGSVDLSRLIDEEPAPAELLFEILNYPDYNGFTATIIDNIIHSAYKSGLSFHGKHGAGYLLERGQLVPLRVYGNSLKVIFDSFDSVEINDIFKITLLKPTDFHPTRDPNIAYFDAVALKSAGPFTLRRPETGDRMRPFGMKSTKLLSDIFANQKIPYYDRLRSPVITDARGEIIWLPGIRHSAHYPVTPSTHSILKISLQ